MGEAGAGSACSRPRTARPDSGEHWRGAHSSRAAQEEPEARKLGAKRDKAQGRSQPRQAAHREQSKRIRPAPR